MTSRLDPEFIKRFRKLPQRVQKLARRNYLRWKQNPRHPSVEFKRIHPRLPVFSIRVGIDHRAVGVEREGDVILWFFIGSHAEYDQLIARM